MTSREPRIVARRDRVLSPWASLTEVEVESNGTSASYHGISTRDYVAVLTITSDGWIPLVHQFRPIVAAYTVELPAGLVDEGETPEAAGRKEVLEETGLEVTHMVQLASGFSDTGRLSNQMHSFLAHTAARATATSVEPGIEIEWVRPAQLIEAIEIGEFRHQLHVAVVGLAVMFQKFGPGYLP